MNPNGITSRQTKKTGSRSIRERWLGRLRLLLGVLTVVGVFGALAGLVWWRLNNVDGNIRRSLADTVSAEVTALRIADRPGYMNVQRADDDVWRQVQADRFDAYQDLKTRYDVQLTGEVLDVTLDGPRGRVQVQEIIDGVPYVQTWFYWRYSERGWRHVAPDYTFWGEADTQTQGNVTVDYHAVDAPLAEAMMAQLPGWLERGCAVLGCTMTPQVTVEIVSQEGIDVQWSESDPWRLIVPSVYIGRARLDRPFDTGLRVRVAELLVSRLASQSANVAPVTYPSDTFYVRESAQTWLVGAFSETDRGSYLIDSYVARYGQQALQTALATLQPESNLNVLAAAAGVDSVAALAVDWRDYLTWRLAVEADLNAQRDQTGFNALYDMSDAAAAQAATVNFNQPPVQDREVIAVQGGQDAQGTPILQATARVGTGDSASEQMVVFRLVGGSWKRIN